MNLQKLLNVKSRSAPGSGVIICCFLGGDADGFDTAAIGFIAPDIRSHWQLTAGDLAPLFGAGLLGLTAGRCSAVRSPTAFGRKRVILSPASRQVRPVCSLSASALIWPDAVFLKSFLTVSASVALMPNTITMTSEYLPVWRRGRW